MGITIGSARIDENGKAHGGKAGDQNGREVCTQAFYEATKGWYIFRAKSRDHAKKLANAMKRACSNDNIGYDQDQRYGVIKNHTDSKIKTECDCSSLVRECIIEATNYDPGDFNTESEPRVLKASGLFENRITYKSGTKLYTGDILVTKSKGHTVIVTSGAEKTKVAEPTLRRGSVGAEVEMLQKNLKSLGFKSDDKKTLSVDGEFGPKTEQAVKSFQKSTKLVTDGIYGPKTYNAMLKKIE